MTPEKINKDNETIENKEISKQDVENKFNDIKNRFDDIKNKNTISSYGKEASLDDSNKNIIYKSGDEYIQIDISSGSISITKYDGKYTISDIEQSDPLSENHIKPKSLLYLTLASDTGKVELLKSNGGLDTTNNIENIENNDAIKILNSVDKRLNDYEQNKKEKVVNIIKEAEGLALQKDHDDADNLLKSLDSQFA